MPRSRGAAHRSARQGSKLICQVVRERDFQLVADRVVDLSASGARVAPADPVLTGERVILSFQNSRGGWVDADATVARVIHGRRSGEHTRSLGLAFEELDPSSRSALHEALSTLVTAPPGARRERRSQPR